MPRSIVQRLFAAAMLIPAHAAIASPSAVTVTRPAGFEMLIEPQRVVADLYYHGVGIGQVTIWTAPGALRFDDVDAVIARLPDVADRAALRTALARPSLDPHAGLVCERAAEDAGGACGRLPADQTGVIFDQRHFRIDLFVASGLLAVRPIAEQRYLSPSTRSPSLVGFVSATVAGTGDRKDDRDYNVTTRLIAGSGDARLRTEASYASGYGAIVDTFAAELDRPDVRYSAGAMWVPGIDLTGRRKLVGIGVRSQLDTRLDRDVVIGTPLIVSLLRRSRVDIIRDGRLVASRIYDAGNQTLDTSGMPDGAYQVTLRIQEAGGAAHEERRFFSKNAAIPSLGQRVFFAYAGALADSTPRRIFAVSDTPYLQAGGAQRLNAHLAVDATVIATDRSLIGEAGGVLLRSTDQIRLAGLASSRGDAGIIVQANSSGAGRLNYSLDARQIWRAGGRPLLPIDRYARATLLQSSAFAALGGNSLTEVSGAVNYRLGASQLGLSGTIRHSYQRNRYYAVGPTFYAPILQRMGVQLNLRADATISNRGSSAFLGLSFARFGTHSNLTATSGIRSTSGTSAEDGTAAVGGISASWQRENVLGGDLAVTGGVEHDVGTTLARGRADLRTGAASFYADVLQPLEHERTASGQTQFSANATTSFSVGGGHVLFDGRRHDDSMIIVSVDGIKGAPFEVYVDGSPRGTLRAGGNLALSVPAYRRYSVRIKSTGDALVRTDGAARVVSVYPGTVARLNWRANPVQAMYGRLAWLDGTPVAGAMISAAGDIAQSDDRGFFQIETTADALMTARARDGRTCTARLNGATIDSYGALGTIICAPQLPATLMARLGGAS